MTGFDMVLGQLRRGILWVRPDGTIWKLRDLRGVPLASPRQICTISNGYIKVKIEEDGRQGGALAHRLVWTVLRGPIPDGLVVNHIDGNRTNNDPRNLEVVTLSENTQHAVDTGLLQKRNRAAELAPRVEKLREKGLPHQQIADRLGVSRTTVHRALKKPVARSMNPRIAAPARRIAC